jgi:hypothetical protein
VSEDAEIEPRAVAHAYSPPPTPAISLLQREREKMLLHFLVDPLLSINICDFLTLHKDLKKNRKNFSMERNITNPTGWDSVECTWMLKRV